MIYTLTFNPALDCYMQVGTLTRGSIHQAENQTVCFGGKGINVSVMLARLGVRSVAMGFVAGFVGEALCDFLTAEGVETDMIRLPEGMTRINCKLTEKDQTETDINAKGPFVPQEALARLTEKIKHLGAEDMLVLSGSAPATLPADTYARIVSMTSRYGARVVVDARGELLLQTLTYHPYLIKPNLQELAEVTGRSLPAKDVTAVKNAVYALQAQGARNVLVSMGRDGALLLTEQGACYAAPALGGDAVSTVGAGDSMLAGFIAGMNSGSEYALRLGLAAGGATAMTWGLATAEDVRCLFDKAH